MDLPAAMLSPTGRLAPRPFAVAIFLIYAVGFAAQTLLAPAVPKAIGLGSFVLVQALLIWIWFALHAKRLRDAGCGVGGAAGIAALCALAVLLFILLTAVFQQAATADPDEDWRFLGLVAISYVFTLISNGTDFGAFGFVLAALLLLAIAPFLIALGFSVWTGTRPRTSEQIVPAAVPAASS
jgi:hypothetical protein